MILNMQQHSCVYKVSSKECGIPFERVSDSNRSLKLNYFQIKKGDFFLKKKLTNKKILSVILN